MMRAPRGYLNILEMLVGKSNVGYVDAKCLFTKALSNDQYSDKRERGDRKFSQNREERVISE